MASHIPTFPNNNMNTNNINTNNNLSRILIDDNKADEKYLMKKENMNDKLANITMNMNKIKDKGPYLSSLSSSLSTSSSTSTTSSSSSITSSLTKKAQVDKLSNTNVTTSTLPNTLSSTSSPLLTNENNHENHEIYCILCNNQIKNNSLSELLCIKCMQDENQTNKYDCRVNLAPMDYNLSILQNVKIDVEMSKKEQGSDIKEQGLSRKEQGLDKNKQGLGSKEQKSAKKEEEPDKEEQGLDRKEQGLDIKEQGLSRKKQEFDRKETGLVSKEPETNIKAQGLSKIKQILEKKEQRSEENSIKNKKNHKLLECSIYEDLFKMNLLNLLRPQPIKKKQTQPNNTLLSSLQQENINQIQINSNLLEDDYQHAINKEKYALDNNKSMILMDNTAKFIKTNENMRCARDENCHNSMKNLYKLTKITNKKSFSNKKSTKNGIKSQKDTKSFLRKIIKKTESPGKCIKIHPPNILQADQTTHNSLLKKQILAGEKVLQGLDDELQLPKKSDIESSEAIKNLNNDEPKIADIQALLSLKNKTSMIKNNSPDPDPVPSLGLDHTKDTINTLCHDNDISLDLNFPPGEELPIQEQDDEVCIDVEDDNNLIDMARHIHNDDDIKSELKKLGIKLDNHNHYYHHQHFPHHSKHPHQALMKPYPGSNSTKDPNSIKNISKNKKINDDYREVDLYIELLTNTNDDTNIYERIISNKYEFTHNNKQFQYDINTIIQPVFTIIKIGQNYQANIPQLQLKKPEKAIEKEQKAQAEQEQQVQAEQQLQKAQEVQEQEVEKGGLKLSNDKRIIISKCKWNPENISREDYLECMNLIQSIIGNKSIREDKICELIRNMNYDKKLIEEYIMTKSKKVLINKFQIRQRLFRQLLI